MKKILLTILVSTLFTTNSYAKNEAGGDCPEGCKNKIEGMPVGDGSSIDQFVKVAEKLPSTEFPPMFLKMVCSFANSTKHESMMKTIERKGYKLENIYLDLDCSKVGLTGPTLMHLLIKEDHLIFALRLARELYNAKENNSNLDTGRFFNMKVPYPDPDNPLTVVGVLNRLISRIKKKGGSYKELDELRNYLEKNLDAKLDPNNN